MSGPAARPEGSGASPLSGQVRPDPDAYASSEDAARLIGTRTGRIIRKWMEAAGYEPIPNAGYRVADLCAVLNARTWPGQFPVTPDLFRTVPMGPGNDREIAAVAAVSDEAGDSAVERFAGFLDALTAQREVLAGVAAELAAQRERAERAEATGAAMLAELRAIRAAAEAANLRDAARLAEQERALDAAGAELARLSAEVAALRARRPWWAFWRRGE